MRTKGMPSEPHFHPVFKSLNKPLTIWGVERRLFFLALIMGGATFNFFGSFLSGLAMFTMLCLFGRLATATEPEFLRILLNSSRFKTQYDPAKREPFPWQIDRGRS
jgi:type IV secretory pathway VirB3-like protein